MKYAKFSDEFLSYFRLDDNGETLVLTDKRGYSRSVKLLTYEEKPQGDLISREALRKAFKAWKTMDDYYHNTDCNNIPFSEAFDLIDNAPTVEINTNDIEYKAYCKGLEGGKKIARPQGEWKLDSLGAYCSECGTHPDYTTDFCSNCGADMRKGGAEE